MEALRRVFWGDKEAEPAGNGSDQSLGTSQRTWSPREKELQQRLDQQQKQEQGHMQNGNGTPRATRRLSTRSRQTSSKQSLQGKAISSSRDRLKRKPLRVLSKNASQLQLEQSAHHEAQEVGLSPQEVEAGEPAEEVEYQVEKDEGPRARILRDGVARVVDEVRKGTLALMKNLRQDSLPTSVTRSQVEKLYDQVLQAGCHFIEDDYEEILECVKGVTCMNNLDKAHLAALKRGEVGGTELASAEEHAGQGTSDNGGASAADSNLELREIGAPRACEVQHIPNELGDSIDMVSRELHHLDARVEEIGSQWKETAQQASAQECEMEGLLGGSDKLISDLKQRSSKYRLDMQ